MVNTLIPYTHKPNAEQVLFAGVASIAHGDKIEIGLSANDASYSVDFMVCQLDGPNARDGQARSKFIADFIVKAMREYQHRHLWYILGDRRILKSIPS
jgi:hypothetical protein